MAVERDTAETAGHDEVIIQTRNQGAVRVLERELPLQSVEELVGECWQFVFKQVTPRGTYAGEELRTKLCRLRPVRPAAVHPAQTHLSDFGETEDDGIDEE